MSENMVEIMNRGMKCLTEQMGIIEAERFISIIIREKFDYTKWQREYFDQMKPGQFRAEALEYAKKHPHEGKGKRI